MKFFSFDWLKNKTAKRYLHSYLLISIVPVMLIVAIFCFTSASSLRQQAEKDMQNRLDQIKIEMDAAVSYMSTSMSHFSQLLTATDLEPDRIPQQLSTYERNFYLPSTPVYFPRGNSSIYTTERKVPYDDFLKSGPWREQLDLAKFYTKLNSVTGTTLTSSKTFGGTGNYLIYMSPVPNLDVTPLGTAAFLIEKSQIDMMLLNQLGELGGCFLMYDNFYGLAYSYGSESLISEITNYVNVPDGGGAVTHQNVADQSYVMMRTVSGSFGFTYFYAVPARDLYEPVTGRIQLYIALGAAVILFLLIAAYLSTAHSFRPIQKLASDLLEIPSPEQQSDLLEEISSRYRSVTAQNDSLQEQIQQQYQMSRQRVLTSLLYGWRGTRSALDKTLRQVETSFPHPDFLVIVVQLDEEHEPQELLAQVYEQPWASARPWNIYLLDTSTPHTAALLFNLERDPEIRQLVADELAELLRQNGCPQARIGAGGYRDDPMNIGASYCEALVALQEGSDKVSLFSKPDETRENFLCPQAEGKIFQQSLLNANREMTLELLGQMAGEVTAHRLPFHAERCFCFFITNLILQISPSLNTDFSEDEMIYMAANAQLDQFLPFCENLIIQICRQIEERRSSDQDRQAELLLGYIRDNFGDYSLSVESLTARFGISERTVRQILREHTGGGLTSYLTTLRMAWIKQQLIETDTPIRELIAQVGYTDVSSFTRKFKLLEGMTPGQYRSVSRGE